MADPRILLADDHVMITKSLRRFLELEFNYREITGVTSCREVMTALKSKKFTHLVLDLGLSDGSSLEILPAIRSLYPTLKIMVLSMQPMEIFAQALRKKYGITHFITKLALEEDMATGMSRFFSEDPHDKPEGAANPGGARSVATNQAAGDSASPGATAQGRPASNPFSTLSPRELEVLHYLLNEKGITEIANILGLQRSSVSTLKLRIFQKTKTSNMYQLKELSGLYNIQY